MTQLIPLVNGEIYTLKLVTGEEVVAKVKDGVRNDWYEVSKPCTVISDPSGKVRMVPSALTMELDKSVTINKSAVAMIFDANDSVKKSYEQATSGIIQPKKPTLLKG